MNEKEKGKLEQEMFKITELDEDQLEDVAGGGINLIGCNDSQCKCDPTPKDPSEPTEM